MATTVRDWFGLREPDQIAGRKKKDSHLVGVEIELEEVFQRPDLGKWKAVKDGSLKVHGQEFTLCTWHTNVFAAFLSLFKQLGPVSISQRCSVHVHVNITDFTIEQIKSLLLLYILFEKALFKFSGGRWNNIFCVPLQTSIAGLNLDITYFDTLAQFSKKYSALHLIPEGKYSTVEFRHMVGTLDPSYIQTWVNILVSLVKYAKETNYEELKEKTNNMRFDSEYINLAQTIFKENYHLLSNYPEFFKEVEEGVLITKLITE